MSHAALTQLPGGRALPAYRHPTSRPAQERPPLASLSAAGEREDPGQNGERSAATPGSTVREAHHTAVDGDGASA